MDEFERTRTEGNGRGERDANFGSSEIIRQGDLEQFEEEEGGERSQPQSARRPKKSTTKTTANEPLSGYRESDC